MYENLCQPDHKTCSCELRSCFYRVEAANSSRLDIHLNFSHNSANNSGTVLYGGALDLCSVNGNQEGYQLLQNISTFIPSIKQQNSSIASEPLKACFCENGSINCSNRNKTVNIVPGRTFRVSIITVGQLDTPVSSTITTTGKFLHSDISTEKKYNIKNTSCANIPLEFYEQETIEIYPNECTGSPLHVEVTVAPCPNGFELINKQCECDQLLQDASCDIQSGLIRR